MKLNIIFRGNNMKNIIYKTKKFIFKNITFIIMFILLFISLFSNINKQNELNDIMMNKNITGTYIMGDEKSEDAEYIVFEKNVYYKYKQFQFLEKNNYENYYNNIYKLKTVPNSYIVHENNEIYFFNLSKNTVNLYSKISDKSLFINVTIK